MEEHKVGLGTKLFQCEICKKRFHYRTHLRSHLRDAEESTLCVHCGESFSNGCDLKMHKKIHAKERYREKVKMKPKKYGPSKCSYCDLILPNPSKRATHMYNVHGHGAEFCDICGKRFQNKTKLNIHLTVHLTDKSAFKCQYCGKGFNSKAKVDRHVSTVHTSDAEKKFHCTECGRGFNERHLLKTHMNIHLGIKPHKCDVCGVGFTDKSNMLAHRRKTCKQL